MRTLLTVIVALVPVIASAQSSYQVLHVFPSFAGDGAHAWGEVVEGPDGSLYGTTQYGGAFNAGTVYRMTRAGAVTVLYSFTGGSDGALPSAGLVLANDGQFYGTTYAGGSGFGTVFRITASGALTVLHRFGGYPLDGESPVAPLIQGSDGNLYGVTFSGGASGWGTVYRVALSGAFNVVYNFPGCCVQASPTGALVEVSPGTFYGTTRFGAIYSVTTAGQFTFITQLHGPTEGTTIEGGLTLGNDGMLYGAARNAGPNGNGTIFRITPTGVVTVLHAFASSPPGGPQAGLALGPDGALYGSTLTDFRPASRAQLFRITPSGQFSVLRLMDLADSYAVAPLLPASDGSFYGTTVGEVIGAPAGSRSVAFRLTVPMPVPASPFGFVDTPSPGATVAGEVPVTGWALDNTAVTSVKIYRSPLAGEPTQPNGFVFLGDATFVDGARPDVAALFPFHPNNTRAGWGFNVLSNMLPNGGTGTFTLHAIAQDDVGATTLLGSRAIVANNSTSPLPFGTIDTPAQGATVSGVVDNFGWALTPMPAAIPLDGSTITVYVDGVAVGTPTYNLFRSDIAALFPGYANSNGAVGHFSLDTTLLTNGLHTISWVVMDDRGNAQGIGSRFFTVANP